MNNNIIVTASASNIRRWARQALAGHWQAVVLATGLYLVLLYAFELTAF